MAKDRESVVQKIEKLMRKTREAGASEAEAEVALGVARKLMDEYNIELAEVMAEAASDKALGIDDIAEEVVRECQSIVKFEKLMLQVVTPICDVQAYISIGKTWDPKKLKYKYCKKYVLYGFSVDVLAAKALYLELLIVVRAMARANIGKGWSRRHHAYANGFVMGLVHQANKLQRASRAEQGKRTDCTALIVRKDELITQYATQQLNLKKGTSRGVHGTDSDEFWSGMKHGKEYEIDADRSQKMSRQPSKRIGGE